MKTNETQQKRSAPSLEETLSKMQRNGGQYLERVAQMAEDRGLKIINQVDSNYSGSYIDSYANSMLKFGGPFVAGDVVDLYDQDGIANLDILMEREKGSDWIKTAIKMYNMAGLSLRAGGAAEKAGLIEMALEIYENSRNYNRAARTAEKAGITDRAIDNYLVVAKNTKDFHSSLDALKSAANITEKEYGVYEAMDIYHNAALKGLCNPNVACTLAGRIAERAGLHEKAIEIYEKYKRYGSAERVARDNGIEYSPRDTFPKKVSHYIKSKLKGKNRK